MVFTGVLDKLLIFVHRSRGRRGFCHEMTEKARPLCEILVQISDALFLEKAMSVTFVIL